MAPLEDPLLFVSRDAGAVVAVEQAVEQLLDVVGLAFHDREQLVTDVVVESGGASSVRAPLRVRPSA